MLGVIQDSVDEGLENHKRKILTEVLQDNTILTVHDFSIENFKIEKISEKQAIRYKDKYIDTVFYQQDDDDPQPELEPVRLLSTAFEYHGNYYQLTIINSMIEESDLMKYLLYSVIVLLSALVVCILIVNNIILQRLWRPFYKFLGSLKNYRLGNIKQKPEIDTQIIEFMDLQNAIDDLIGNNEKVFESQKQFTGNAAHEIQTPLAIIQNKLELFVEGNQMSDKQLTTISEIMEVVQRLTKLNKALLLLTKIENKQYFNNQDLVFNSIVKIELNELADLIQFKNIRISLIEDETLNARIDPSLASIIVLNLLKNAIYHNLENGEINIQITKSKFIVQNTGVNEEIDKDKIFTRFYKQHLHSHGTGLGLTMVKTICSLYHFKIFYDFDGKYHRFEIDVS